MVAASQLALRTNSLLTLEFYLGGLYVVAFNRLAPYCRKPEAVNRFVAREYGITFPIWFYWASIIRAATSAELPGMHKSTPEFTSFSGTLLGRRPSTNARSPCLTSCLPLKKARPRL